VYGAVEALIEGKERSAELEAIASELELVASVDVKYLELGRGADWTL